MTHDYEKAFWSKVEIKSEHECWPWISPSTNGYGYGRSWFVVNGKAKLVGAHRVAFFLKTGIWPDRHMDVMHSCDFRLCCNPSHLSVGTRTDNMRDCARKGRTNRIDKTKGERKNTAKLTENQVANIRQLLIVGTSPSVCARQYNIQRENVYSIRDYKTWKWVEPRSFG
jgi:hypothetical protein